MQSPLDVFYKYNYTRWSELCGAETFNSVVQETGWNVFNIVAKRKVKM